MPWNAFASSPDDLWEFSESDALGGSNFGQLIHHDAERDEILIEDPATGAVMWRRFDRENPDSEIGSYSSGNGNDLADESILIGDRIISGNANRGQITDLTAQTVTTVSENLKKAPNFAGGSIFTARTAGLGVRLYRNDAATFLRTASLNVGPRRLSLAFDGPTSVLAYVHGTNATGAEVGFWFANPADPVAQNTLIQTDTATTAVLSTATASTYAPSSNIAWIANRNGLWGALVSASTTEFITAPEFAGADHATDDAAGLLAYYAPMDWLIFIRSIGDRDALGSNWRAVEVRNPGTGALIDRYYFQDGRVEIAARTRHFVASGAVYFPRASSSRFFRLTLPQAAAGPDPFDPEFDPAASPGVAPPTLDRSPIPGRAGPASGDDVVFAHVTTDPAVVNELPNGMMSVGWDITAKP